VNLEALVRALLARNDGRIADEREVNARERHKVGLELVQVDVERAIEAQARGDGADDLRNEAVEMLVVGTRDVQVATANVIDGLVVDEESAVRVLDGAVGGEDSVVRLNDGG
jgi:hypothetical protein